jgi:hypothetical protein
LKSITQPSGVSHIAIGDIVVSAINDGVFPASFDDLVTPIARPARAPISASSAFPRHG